MRHSSSRSLAICPLVNAIKKSLPRKRDPDQNKSVFSQIFYQTAPSRGRQQHHPAPALNQRCKDVPLSRCIETIPISLLSPCCSRRSSAGICATEKVFLAVCKLLSRCTKERDCVYHSRVKYFQGHKPDCSNSSLTSLASGSSFNPLLLWSTSNQ